MADYYPLLVRAIAGLPSNTAETRKMMFDRARNTLLKQLRGVEPPLPEGEITRERQSLEEAIRRIEAEQKARAPVAEPPAPVEPPPPEKPAAPPPEPAAIAPPPAPSGSEPPRRRLGETAARSAFPPPPEETPPQAVSDDAATDQRPTLGKPKVASRTARPRMPVSDEDKASGRGRRTLIYFGLAIVAVGGIALAVVNHDTLEQIVFSRSAPPPAPTQQGADAARPASEPAKSADRVAQASGDAARRPPPMPQRPTSGTQRAVLFEESASGPQGLQSYEGTVTWKTETFNAGPGLPPDTGIRAELQIPERRMALSFVLRRNTDQTLPASHTIEIGFTLPQDFPYGGITNVPGIRMKQTEAAQGAPLVGLSVRVNPTYFLVGLSAVPADRQRNIQLLQSRPWIDIPVVYTNNKRAIIAFEKGAPGEQAFQDAFTAWGEWQPQAPAPPPPLDAGTAPMTAPAPGGG
ncbi:hypothetical protein [Roseixanthobacter glucoisosaccharinicivorans]|uniref:hypothetical protein n=1 Tax=Roseixanthobacter glucoisosaccharinicivorans TaxID=3119923 RepID=UPI00372997E7